jgi:hypothetical protein
MNLVLSRTRAREALLDRGAQVFSIEPLQHPSPPPADGRR